MRFVDLTVKKKKTTYKGIEIEVYGREKRWGFYLWKGMKLISDKCGFSSFKFALKEAIKWIDGKVPEFRIHWSEGDNKFTFKRAEFNGLNVIVFLHQDNRFSYVIVGIDFNIKSKTPFNSFPELEKHLLNWFAYNDTKIVSSLREAL